MQTNKIHNIDALKGLKQLPDNYVDCSLSSPPYWALRDYSTEGQLGLEPTFDEYLTKLCDIYDEVKRVLKPSGTCWVNLGDTYTSTNEIGSRWDTGKTLPLTGSAKKLKELSKQRNGNYKINILQEKSLTLIPYRFAIEMVNRGWILRNVIIWRKPNCMPSSAKDRFTVDFEYLFFFVKQKKYFFEAQYEEQTTHKTEDRLSGHRAWDNDPTLQRGAGEGSIMKYNQLGINKRTVWSICPQPFGEGVCPICGYYGKPKGK